MVYWQLDNAGQFRSADITNARGQIVHLTVERLGCDGWDWQVWDAGSQIAPRYGRAPDEASARRQAEMTLHAINASLLAAPHP